MFGLQNPSPGWEDAPDHSPPLVVQGLQAEVPGGRGDRPDLAGPVPGVEDGVAVVVTGHLSPHVSQSNISPRDFSENCEIFEV